MKHPSISFNVYLSHLANVPLLFLMHYHEYSKNYLWTGYHENYSKQQNLEYFGDRYM